MKFKIVAVIGARPQFIKHAPIDLAFKKSNIDLFTIHTGQHYDEKMSEVFFKELNISPPDILLNIGSHNHGRQTGLMMMEMEDIIIKAKADAVLIYGDTNSTLAGALVASKLRIPVIHIEAGLRSNNLDMPEEINRILSDRISSLLFAPTESAKKNLENEGITAPIHIVGDVMYDMILVAKKVLAQKQIEGNYYLSTIHRPYNTDDINRLVEILNTLNNLDDPVKFPIHPRTMNRLKSADIDERNYKNITFMEPQSYFQVTELLNNSKGLITDSGGMQKEAYWMKKKCITLRSETEWVETLNEGWNTLIFDDLSLLKKEITQLPGKYTDNIYGDGRAAEEIAQIIKEFLSK